jgi:hypothetical protein
MSVYGAETAQQVISRVPVHDDDRNVGHRLLSIRHVVEIYVADGLQ